MTNNVNGITSDSSGQPDRASADRAQVKAVAQQFEAMLMTQMLREMRRSMLDDEDEKENSLGAGTMTDTLDIELGQSLSRAGGVGLTDSLLKAFERQTIGAGELIGAGGAGKADGAGGVNAAGRLAEELSKPVVPAAPPLSTLPAPSTLSTPPAPPAQPGPPAPAVTSPFGWRQDPITGGSSFHQGVDLKMAYGRDVKAAAAGTVAFAGTQGGYGQTVVINHEGGRQTRYAHLSAENVQAGDVVSEGQIIGKSGNSGRSTGPHLHFELLVDGHPVDPAGTLNDASPKEKAPRVDY